MKLTACVAAKSFSTSRIRHHTRKLRSIWGSIALRWRCSVTQVELRLTHTPSLLASCTWFLQLHLYLGAADKARSWVWRTPSQIQCATATVWRLPRQWLLPEWSLTQGEQSITGHEQPLKRIGEYLALRYQNFCQHLIARSEISLAATIVRRARLASFRLSAPLPLSAILLASVHRHGCIGAIASALRSLPSASLQWPTFASSAHHRVHIDQGKAAVRPASTVMGHVVELVWRVRATSEINPIGERRTGSLLGSSIEAPGMASVRSLSAPAFSQPQEAALINAMPLNSELLDRLTQDVIRRVERHVRIERERRGI